MFKYFSLILTLATFFCVIILSRADDDQPAGEENNQSPEAGATTEVPTANATSGISECMYTIQQSNPIYYNK